MDTQTTTATSFENLRALSTFAQSFHNTHEFDWSLTISQSVNAFS